MKRGSRSFRRCSTSTASGPSASKRAAFPVRRSLREPAISAASSDGSTRVGLRRGSGRCRETRYGRAIGTRDDHGRRAGWGGRRLRAACGRRDGPCRRTTRERRRTPDLPDARGIDGHVQWPVRVVTTRHGPPGGPLASPPAVRSGGSGPLGGCPARTSRPFGRRPFAAAVDRCWSGSASSSRTAISSTSTGTAAISGTRRSWCCCTASKGRASRHTPGGCSRLFVVTDGPLR